MTKSFVTPRSRLWRLFQDIGTLFLFGVVIAAIAIGFPRRAARTPNAGRERDSEDRPGAGITVHTQVLQIWLPEPLVDLWAGEPRPAVVHNHQELRAILEHKGYQDLWYAVAVRTFQVNGGTTEILFIRHPYREPEKFQDFLDVLATTAGNPPCSPAADYSSATVQIGLATMSPQEFLRTLKASQLACDPDRSEPGP